MVGVATEAEEGEGAMAEAERAEVGKVVGDMDVEWTVRGFQVVAKEE
jgi:hypothetical protein